LLKLKRVEIQGFKSFFDRTEMKFAGSGIAAVVGPNGCGKSNLSDAISWVLGEQSAKSLRGARMEDVIFAGTRDRKPLGLAAVTMTLVDPAAADAEHENHANGNGHTNGHHKPSEITITRRLFRSGESEYLIDG
jgi:chromosome segregation protein